VEGADPDTVVVETEYSGEGTITFQASNDGPWPTGSYKVELYVNDKLKETLNYDVAGEAVKEAASEISIDNVYMARISGNNVEQTETFNPNDEFNCVLEISGIQSSDTVKAVWTAVDVEDYVPNTQINETESAGNETLTFNLSNPKYWPAGDYKIEIYINDAYQGYLNFKVE
jgi:outer membrane usher protein FimD/PapC